MRESGERQIVLSTPGFPISKQDPDKPFLLNHARALLNAGFRVTVVCPALPHLAGRQCVEGIEVIRVRYAPRRFQTLAATGSMYKEAKGLKVLLVLPMLASMMFATIRELRNRDSIAYGHWWIPGGLVAVIAGRFSRRSTVVHVHGSDVDLADKKLMGPLARVVLRLATVRLAVSQDLAAWVRNVSGRDVDVLPMPLDFDSLPAPSPVPQNGYLLAVGRLVPEKGFNVLIDAVALMASDCRPDLVIVGSGPESENLARQAARRGVNLRLPGAVSPTELSDWYLGARCVTVPSLREGFGLVVAEAAAAGRAVVATSVGATPQLVVDKSSGLIVPPGDPSALADALLRVDPSWGRNGPEQVSEFGMENHGRYVENLWHAMRGE